MKKIIFFLSLAFTKIVLAQPADMKPGSEQARWPIKTSVVDLEATPHELTLDDLFKLPEAPGVKARDPRYADARIPPFDNAAGVKEGDLITVTGWLHLVAFESDGDYHMQISADPEDGNNCLIVETPLNDKDYVKDSDLRQALQGVRDKVDQLMPKGVPSDAGTVLDKPVYVRVTGQLFYDDWHVGQAKARGKKGMKAVNLWELHPVTAFEIISASPVIESMASAQPAHLHSSSDSSPKTSTTMSLSPVNTLALLLLGAFLGLIGQGFRIIVGLKKLNDISGDKDQFNAQFDGRKLLISVFYSVTIGILAGVIMIINDMDTVQLNTSSLMAIITAGYSGTDLIEGFVTKNFKKP